MRTESVPCPRPNLPELNLAGRRLQDRRHPHLSRHRLRARRAGSGQLALAYLAARSDNGRRSSGSSILHGQRDEDRRRRMGASPRARHDVVVGTDDGMEPLGVAGGGGDPPVVAHEASLSFRHRRPVPVDHSTVTCREVTRHRTAATRSRPPGECPQETPLHETSTPCRRVAYRDYLVELCDWMASQSEPHEP